ncbi:hypothetical protein BJ322DRAFT_1184096 [Thelephora terrestris]|uniref:Uncharacterized protein n=1 Tax=Thelephora terrestris TaxID=56493 RepID=A0A9P6LA99_9AGAM|nr:hypothetical protein BJ322DRAFT_1184096 [Thelephora terrestris]
MPRASTRVPTRRSSSYSPVQENNFNIDRFSHARRDASRPYPTLGNVMDRTATADPNEGFTDLGFRDFIQASRRVSRRKLAHIETNPYATELLNRGVKFVTETNETFNSVLEASVIHTGNVGSMLMDEIAHVNERVDGRREEIEKLEKEFLGCHEGILKIEDEQEQHGMAIDRLKGEVITLKDLVRSLVSKTGELEDDKVRLTRRVSELTGEVRDLQRRCNEPEVQIEEEELEVPHRAGSPIIPNRAESPPARLLVRHENRLVPIDDEVIEIRSDEFYQNVGVVRRDTPCPEFVSTPWGSRRQWPALEYDPYAEFVPDSEPNSDTELPDYDDLSDVDPNEIREQNWLNEELDDTPYDPTQHLYDSPANIAHDNRVAMEFLSAHNAPPQVWEEVGYKDPNRAQLWAPGVSPLVDAMDLNEDFTHFALEHWKPFQESLFQYFGHQCRGAYCTDPAPHSPVVPPTPPGSRSPSSSVPSLESCPSSSDGGKDLEERAQESDDSYWTAVSPIEQESPSSNVAEVGSGESSGKVWI